MQACRLKYAVSARPSSFVSPTCNPGRCGRSSRSRALVRTASFLPDAVEDFLTAGTLIASGLAIVGTAALGARSPPKPKPADGFDYGIMGVVSAIPLVNWTAWVLPAIQQPERASLYYAYAGLYAVPLLLEGFDIFEGYVLAMLALGCLHVQVERIAATEPETLKDGRAVAGALDAVAFVIEKVLGFAGSLLGLLAADTKQVIQGPGPSPPQLGADRPQKEVPPEVQELKEFDRQLMARQAAKRRRQRSQQPRQ